jgi:hypothetical protein
VYVVLKLSNKFELSFMFHNKWFQTVILTMLALCVVLGFVYRQDIAAAQYIRAHPMLFTDEFRTSQSGKKFVTLMEKFAERPDLREALLLKQRVLQNAWQMLLMQTFDILAFDEERQHAQNCTDGSEFCAVYRPFIEMVKNDPNAYIKKGLVYWTNQQGEEPLLFNYFDQIVQRCAESNPANPYDECRFKYQYSLVFDDNGALSGIRPTSEFALMDNFQHYLMYKSLSENAMSADSYRAQVDAVSADTTVGLLVNEHSDVVEMYVNVPVLAADARNDPPATFLRALAFADAHPQLSAFLLGSSE